MQPTYRDVLTLAPFRHLWIGQAVSQLGDAFYYLIFLFMVDRITGDPRLVGYNGVVQTLPYLLFSLHAGVVADRVDRRRIMLFADYASALLLALFAVTLLVDPTPPVASLFAAGFLLSLINVFFAPAKGAAIPRLVPPALLLPANALSQATQNLMPLIGLGLSGTVLGALYALSPNYFFLSAVLLNALSFAVSGLYIRLLPPLPPEPGVEKKRPSQELQEGLAYLRGNRVLLMLAVLSLLVQLFISPFMVAYVTVNREWFGGGFGTLALFEFSFMVGMVLSSVVVGRLPLKEPGRAFIWGLAVVGLTVAAMAYSRSPFWFTFWNFAAGIALPFAQIPMNTYVQATVPDAFRGRVNAVLTMVSMGVQPVGAGLAGLILAAIGIGPMFLLMGLGMGFAALVGLTDRQFREARLE